MSGRAFIVVGGLLLAGVASLGVGSRAVGVAVDAADAPPFAPISYFQQSCANCHGDYGRAYGEGFGAGRTEAGLREIVDEMAAGPGFAPLDAAQLDIQTAYHRALIAGEPFVIAWRDGAGLRGEITPEAALTVDGEPATVEGHVWQSDTSGDIVATLGNTSTFIESPADGQTIHSHAEPMAKEPDDEHAP